MKYKILLLGNSWHGNWSLSVRNEMISLGYSVEHVDVWYQSKLKIPRLNMTINNHMFSKIETSLTQKIKTDGITHCIVMTPYTLSPKFWKTVKKHGVKLIGWWGDDPMRKGNMGESMSYFDTIYLVEKSWLNNARFFNAHTFYMPHAASLSHFFPIPNSNKDTDIVFVGDSFKGDMNGQLRANILQRLSEKGLRLSIFGDNYWAQFPQLKSAYRGRITTTDELNTVYNKSRIALNIHHNQLISCTNQRTPEAACSEVFQISDYKPSIANDFGDSIALFSTPEELVQKTLYFISNTKEREKKSQKARAIAVKHHSLKSRVQTMLEA